MRRNWFLALSAACLLGICSTLLAGYGTGPGDGTGTGPCDCGMTIDVDPADGICDICGGCIPIGGGPHGPKGPQGPKK